MTVSEVAEYLQLAERTVLRMSQRGEIPAAKVGSQWRYVRTIIREWLLSKMDGLSNSALKKFSTEHQIGWSFPSVFKSNLVNPNIKAGNKEHVLAQLIEPMKKHGYINETSLFLNDIIEREKMATTAIGGGIALPHRRRITKNFFKETAVVTGVCSEGTDFQAIDGKNVYIFFVICAMDDRIHVQLAARLSRLTRQYDLCNTLRKQTESESIIKSLKAWAIEIEQTENNKKHTIDF